MSIDVPNVPDVPAPSIGGADLRQCRVCGCTDNAGCQSGCIWVPDPFLMGDLCSRCAAAEFARRPPLLLRVLQEVASTKLRMAELPPVADVLALPDCTGRSDQVDCARDLEDVVTEMTASGDLGWDVLLCSAAAQVQAAAAPRVLRRRLIELAAMATWWAMTVEQRAYPPVADGANPPTRP